MGNKQEKNLSSQDGGGDLGLLKSQNLFTSPRPIY